MEGLDLDSIKIPKGGERVYKEECIYSFDTPESEDGLYVSLHSFFGVGKNWLDLHSRKTGESVYLHIKRRVKPKPAEEKQEEPEEPPPEKKPTRLAIGVEGGFTGGIEKVEYEEEHSLLVNDKVIKLPCPDLYLPMKVQQSIDGILSAESASKQDQIAAWEEPMIVTRHAETLMQLPMDKKVPISGWKCERCDLTNNLWLNLTDGSILCGRRYYDGSGGNNHALDHYSDTKYPLAVKLGTITPGGADVYSYDEDSMVLDPKLSDHLSHFGINMMTMSKTDKTMTELQIDANIKLGEWSVIQESGRELKLVYGPGFTGLQNLGNSCYMNSVMQVLFTLPEFKERYYDTAVDTFNRQTGDPTKDFNTQMCKLARGLLTGDYSKPLPPSPAGGSTPEGEKEGQKEQDGIRPSMFKTLIGTGHREFSSNRQQDVQEFFLYLLSVIDRAEHTSRGTKNVADIFRFQVEEKVTCVASGKVRYSVRPDSIFTLPVPMETATNHNDVVAWQQKKAQLMAEKKKINHDEAVRAKVPFSSCLGQYSSSTDIPDFYSTALQAKSPATRIYRFKTFPKYLVLQLAKFSFDENWVPIKFDVEVDVPDALDLSSLRGTGIQPGEEELPDETASKQSDDDEVEIDEEVLSQLAGMGFDIEGCKRAIYHTKNQGIEPAMNWVLEHMGDPDFSEPFFPPGSAKPPAGGGGATASDESIAIISSLGFTRDQAIKALKATDNNVERAADWVFSHIDELQAMEEEQLMGGAREEPMEEEQFNDGNGNYTLMGFISHMGSSTMTGHYVCHIKKDEKWIIFNDNKVAESVAPPKEHAYLYFYKREQ